MKRINVMWDEDADDDVERIEAAYSTKSRSGAVRLALRMVADQIRERDARALKRREEHPAAEPHR